MMKLVSLIGKPVCVILYIAGIVLAVKKMFIPVAALFAMHLSEYFIIGRKTAKQFGISAGKGLLNCLAFGFTWWLPVRKSGEAAGKEETV
ncbi:MAG: hypothetical protein IKH13_01040 [Clostridia bacterium]|nr:hypothetical protein [Clostridia bacterium]